MEFRLLGPLEVCSDGEPIVLAGPKQRAILTILLLNANQVVPRARLQAEVWGERAPGSEHSLDVHISRLRKALTPGGEGSALVRRGRGYLLCVQEGTLDLVRFEQRIAAGQQVLAEGRPAAAAALLNDGLGLWRGEPLAEFADQAFAVAELGRLKELRLAALEARVEADLALGREAAIVGDLESLVNANPYRERFRAQLMLALYRAGRQAEALAVYADTRRLLIDELGIEPGEQLRKLHGAVLAQDPGLRPAGSAWNGSAGTGKPGVMPPGTPRRPGWRRLALLSVAGLVAAAAVLAGTLSPANPAPVAEPGMIQPGSVAFIDAQSGRLVGDVPAGPSVGFIRAGFGSVWEMEDSGVLLQIDPRTRHLTGSIAVGVNPGDVAVGAGAVWITDKNSQTLARISPQYGEITRIPLPAQGLSRPGVGGGVAIGAGSVWVAQGLSRVVRVDPASGRVEAAVSVPDAREVAFGDGAIWVGASDIGMLTKIDPRTGAVVATARIGPWICCLAIGGGYVWAANNTGIWKVASDGRVLGAISAPSQIANVYFGDGALWVAADAAGTVLRINPRTNAARRYRIGHLLTGIGIQGSTVVVSVHPTGSDLVAHLSGPVLEVRNSTWFDDTDPATAAAPGTPNQPWEQQLQYATCEPLLGYPDAPAPAGWRLVPEAAVAWPAVSPDGRTFTFKIRPGLRFSPPSGQPVTAATFKYTIERALSPALGPDAPAVSVNSDIAGVPAYRAGSSDHIGGIRAVGDTLTITLVRPAADFPERIALSYFCPVPIGTPTVPNGLDDPVPSAGPYYLSGNLGGVVAVLRRNPSYHGSRPAGLPPSSTANNSRANRPWRTSKPETATTQPTRTRPWLPEPRSHANSASRPRASLAATSPRRSSRPTSSRSTPSTACSLTPGCARPSTTRSTGPPSPRRSATSPPPTTCRPACRAPARGMSTRSADPTSRGPARWQDRTAGTPSWPSAATRAVPNSARSSRPTWPASEYVYGCSHMRGRSDRQPPGAGPTSSSSGPSLPTPTRPPSSKPPSVTDSPRAAWPNSRALTAISGSAPRASSSSS